MRKITLMLLLSLVSFMAHAQFEGFEGTWTTQTGTGPGGPSGWAIANVAGPINTWIQGNGSGAQPAFAGTKSAFMNSENVLNGTTSEDWLISPLWTVPANGQLRFMSHLFVPQDQGTTYEVRISTTTTGTNPQYTLSNFITPSVASWTELQINPSQNDWAEKIVSLSAYAGQQVYIAFIMKGDNGDRWAIDNVRLVSPCADPATGTANNIGDTTANLTWANPSGATTWEVEIVPSTGSVTGTGQVYSGPLPYPATGLTASTQYTFYVRALCGTGDLAVWSNWVGPFSFATSVCPAAQQCNYTFIMTDSFGDGWNGNTMTISQNGITMATIGASFTTGTGPISVNVPLCTGQPFQLFWNSGGNWAGEVGISIVNPFSQTLFTKPAGTGAQNTLLFTGQADCVNPACLPVSGLTATSPTSNSISLNWGGPNTGNWQYYIAPTGSAAPAFTTPGVATTTKPVTANTVTSTNTPLLPDTTYQFWVRVACDGGTFSTWAGPVSFTTLPTCPKPINLGATGIGDDEVTLTWTEAGTATAWEVYVVTNGTAAPTASTVGTPANSTSFLYNTGLTSGTIYQYYVRALCGPGDLSTWAGPFTFNTTICNPTDQCNYTFVMTDSFGDGWNGNTMTVSQNGINIATFGSTFTTGVGPVSITVPLCNNLPFQLKWNSGGNFANEVGVSVVNSFSQTLFTKPPGTGAQNTVLYTGTVDCLTPACLPPTNLTASGATMDSIQLGWAGPATGNWAYYIVPAGSPAPTATTVPTGTTTTNPVTVNTGLTAGTNYQYYVRVICSGTSNSTWAGPFAFNTTICAAADQCNYTFILTDSFGDGWNGNTMTVSQNGVPVATFGATFTTGVGPVNINVPLCNGEPFQLFWNSGGNFAGEVGVSIRNPFNQILFTKPSGTGTQNTLLYTGEVDCDNPACLPPTAVTVTDETTTSISVNWAASVVPGATYEVYYTLSGGAAPGETPTTNVIPTTTNSVVIPNLTASTIYNIYVRTICSATSNSIWTVPLIHETDPLCPEPIDLEVTCLQSTGASIEWTADGQETSWEVVVQPASQPAPNSGAVVTEPAYLAEGLTPGTLYTAYVRAICPDVDGFSSWAEIDFTPTLGPGNANPFCAGSISVPNSTGVTGYGSIGCLGSTPNPIWYYLTVDDDDPAVGPTGMNFTLTQVNNNGTPIDVDFAAFGPFESALDACSQIQLQPGANPLIVACSFSASATEIFTIPNVQDGQVYALLLTNFNGQAGSITLTQTNANVPGAPTTSCEPNVELGPDKVLCATATTTVTADVADPEGPDTYTYQWFIDGDEFTPTIVETTADSQTIEVDEPGEHIITVLVTTPDTTVNDDPITDTVTITLSPAFTAPTPAPVTLCGTGGTASLDLSAIDFLGTLDPDDYEVEGIYISNANAQSGTSPISGSYTTGTTTLYIRIHDINVPQCFQIVQLSVTVNETPTAAISYADSPYCSGETTGAVTQTGNAGGTYSSTTGLDINATTGAVNITNSTPGTYTVTYTIAATASCPAFSTTAQVVIVAAPEATIAYAGTPYCSDAGAATVTFTGTTGGTYSSTAGLDIDPATGEIDLAASTAGTYTVTYTIPDTGDCAGTAVTTVVTITALPTAAISYAGSPYCSDAGVATVTLTGNAGGTYTADGGLLINASTGEIVLADNAAGTYTVTYTIAAAGGCDAVTATVDVTITELPQAGFSYAYASVCQNAGAQAVTLAPGASAGTYTVDVAGLAIDATTGTVTPGNSQPGVYVVTNTIAAANGCGAVTATFTIEVTPAPVPTFSYAAVAYCQNETTNPIPVLDGASGTFSAPSGLVINPATGEVNLDQSTPGTYTITNTITGSDSCPTVTATTQITITSLPVLVLDQGCVDNLYNVWVSFEDDDIYSEDNVTIEWTKGGAYVANTPSVNISTLGAGTYMVTVTPNDGALCPSSDEIIVTATNCKTPKGISPNGDTLNDTWDLTGFNVRKVVIFNRYGKEVFSFTGAYTDEFAGVASNGEKLPSGTYYYMFERTDGTTETGWVYVNFEE